MRPSLKLSILALLVSAACSSCAGKSVGVVNRASRVDQGVSVFTPTGFGRGCPVNGMIITARHVVTNPKNGETTNAWWSDSSGNDGYAKIYSVSDAVDGAALVPEGPQYPVNVRLGKPVVGEEVYWFNYNYGRDSLASQMQRAKLVRRVGGHLVMSEGATEGASGGCIFNRKGEAIGIIVWVLRFPSNDIGIGLQFPKEWL